MADYFLDTNIILRHVLDDDSDLSPAARRIMEAVEEGRVTAWITDLAIAEAVFVLSSKRLYGLPRDAIATALLPLINLPNLKLPNKRIYSRVFALYTSTAIDFIDAYHVAVMEARNLKNILSFDADFDRIPGITRHAAID